jgi:glycosyltransferase involved in cell wall biosynthesis
MRRTVLLVQPSMQPPGGGNGVAAWALQALVPEFDVTVLSWWPVDVAPINRFFGTSLRAQDFATMVVPAAWRVVPDRLPVPAALMRSSLVMRYTRRVVDRFDVVLGLHNETDYGRRGIQYVHYPTYLRPRPVVDLRWYHAFSPALQAYYAAADRLAGFSLERMKSNLTLCNSNWTGQRIERLLGVRARTLYPPVLDAGDLPPWSTRSCAFVAMGRISPEKEYERVIRIIARVRESAPTVTLTIVGTYDARSVAYYRSLVALARSLDPTGQWFSIRRDLSREDVRTLLTTTRYGIHGMREEHFGMAPAEMVRAGMVVWVPDGGGQVEIVGKASGLRYADEEDAVNKILDVMQQPNEERHLREYLRVHSQRFSHVHFMEQIRDVVDTFHS